MESAIKSQMQIEENMRIAYSGGLRTIAQLIPYLEQRAVAAKRYFGPSITAKDRDTLVELVEHINGEIRKIIGVIPV